jgi:hypothetical protein
MLFVFLNFRIFFIYNLLEFKVSAGLNFWARYNSNSPRFRYYLLIYYK